MTTLLFVPYLDSLIGRGDRGAPSDPVPAAAEGTPS
jgi:hypothetical protein